MVSMVDYNVAVAVLLFIFAVVLLSFKLYHTDVIRDDKGYMYPFGSFVKIYIPFDQCVYAVYLGPHHVTKVVNLNKEYKLCDRDVLDVILESHGYCSLWFDLKFDPEKSLFVVYYNSGIENDKLRDMYAYIRTVKYE